MSEDNWSVSDYSHNWSAPTVIETYYYHKSNDKKMI
jgi:hypothetical protein